jgi:uncharacterized phage protein (TIGR01671 family)
MREIKFRAWNKVDEHMVEPEDLYDPYIFRDSPYHELMQYTGLKDKNGVEIYEGDILASEPSYYRKIDGTRDMRIPESSRWQQKQVVEWGKWQDFSGGYEAEPGEFYGWSINPEELNPPSYSSERDSGSEVIGNIYENPELLKETTK